MRKLGFSPEKLSSITKLLFYFCYFWMLTTLLLKKVNGAGAFLVGIYPACRVVLIVLCALNLFRIPKRKVPIYLLIMIVGFISKLVTNSDFVFLTCLLITGCVDINFEKLIKTDIKFKLIMLLIVSALYFVGATSVYLHYRGDVVRHSMGFANPNIFSNYVMSVVVEYLFLKRKSLKLTDIAIAVVGMLIVNYFAGSRTQLICLIILTVILYAKRFRHFRGIINNRALSFALRNSFTIMLGLSILISFAFNWNVPMLNELNVVTAGRVSSAAEHITKGHLALIGGAEKDDDDDDDDSAVLLDNVFTYLLVAQGIIITLLICIFMNRFMSFCYNKNRTIMAIMVIFIVGGLMEHFCLEVPFNIFLLYSSHMLFKIDQVKNGRPLSTRDNTTTTIKLRRDYDG